MLLDLRTIMYEPGGRISFETSLDFSSMQFGNGFPLRDPVKASGYVRNTAGVLELKGSVRVTIGGTCDRCAEQFVREENYELQAILVSDADSDDYEDPWVFELQQTSVDLDEIITAAVVLNMDSKLLCREDCKGLCFRCGRNLNLGPCDCKPEIDPRLAALQQLLEKE